MSFYPNRTPFNIRNIPYQEFYQTTTEIEPVPITHNNRIDSTHASHLVSGVENSAERGTTIERDFPAEEHEMSGDERGG